MYSNDMGEEIRTAGIEFSSESRLRLGVATIRLYREARASRRSPCEGISN
jgi:hypothetical protein